MKVIDDLFELLSDGKTHTVDGISKKLNLPPEKVIEICRFFDEYCLISFLEETSEIWIKRPLQTLLKKIAEVEEKEEESEHEPESKHLLRFRPG